MNGVVWDLVVKEHQLTSEIDEAMKSLKRASDREHAAAQATNRAQSEVLRLKAQQEGATKAIDVLTQSEGIDPTVVANWRKAARGEAT